MADAIRKDQQNQTRSIELASSRDEGAPKTSIPQTISTNTRTVGRKHKQDSPISQVTSAKYLVLSYLLIINIIIFLLCRC